MAERIVTTEELVGALRAAAASGDRDVFAPVLRDGRISIEPLAEGTKPHVGPGVSARSPKDFFFPPSEEMLRYARTERGMELEEVAKAGGRPVLLFGVRPCAGRAVGLLDRLFDFGDYRDPGYVARREATTVVGLACGAPLSTCFCTSAGGDPFGTDGLDALVADLGADGGEGRYLVRTLTEKGEAALGSAGAEAAADDASRAEEAAKAARDAMGNAVPVAEVVERLGADLVGAFESGLWARFHEKCLGCAACAFTCPTCHCFNIADESTLAGGRRVRTWDCCMMPLFTKHVSGHNPRGSTRERMRQRIMHKFLYYVKNFKDAACVGCGRCVRACPVNNDLRDVLRAIAAAELGAPAEA